jgi:hypothetical protein
MKLGLPSNKSSENQILTYFIHQMVVLKETLHRHPYITQTKNKDKNDNSVLTMV